MYSASGLEYIRTLKAYESQFKNGCQPVDTCPSPSFGCSEGHRGANRYLIIIPVLALLILIFPILTLPPKRLDMYKKRRKDHSCTSTSPTVWSLPLARPRAGYTRSQPQHQGNAKGVKKQVWLNQVFIVVRMPSPSLVAFLFSFKGVQAQAYSA